MFMALGISAPLRACGRRAPEAAPWIIRPDGIGPIRVGMSVAEASGALGDELAVRGGAGASCAYVHSARLPAGMSLMVAGDTIVRVDVDSNTVATDSGVRVGDSVAAVRARYHDSLRSEPNKYQPAPAHNLVFEPTGDSLHRIIFETDGQRVTTLRSGRLPQVAYVERCG